MEQRWLSVRIGAVAHPRRERISRRRREWTMRNAVINRIAMAALVVALAGCSGSNTGTNSASSESGASGSGAASGNAAAPAKAPAAPPIVVAEGTVIPVTLDQSVGTKNSNVGDGFDAS